MASNYIEKKKNNNKKPLKKQAKKKQKQQKNPPKKQTSTKAKQARCFTSRILHPKHKTEIFLLLLSNEVFSHPNICHRADLFIILFFF